VEIEFAVLLARQAIRSWLTPLELAFKADISRNYVSLLELGEKSPTVQALLRICKALSVKASRIIARIERN
jgi:transcriptional regulator with XRE-family HTH domain